MPDLEPEHYASVMRSMSEGQVVPLLGAGVNLCDRPSGQAWELGHYLPSGSELADYLARTFYFPELEERNLLRVSQFVVTKEGSGPLYAQLRKLFDANYPVTPVHDFFATLPGRLRERGTPSYQVILTTNYDDALERAFDAVDEPYDVVWYIAEGEPRGKFWHRPPGGTDPIVIERPNSYDGLAVDERTVILKIHGAIDRQNADRDSYVITEDHYIDYLAHGNLSQLIPAYLMARMRTSHFLFLGYSMRDWNLRVILHRIWGERKRRNESWAVQAAPEEIETRFWKDRGVDILDIRLERYIAELQAQLEMRFGALAA